MPIELEEAIALLLEHTHSMGQEETPVVQANGRVLFSDIYAPISVPPFDRSPLDGYALIASDTTLATHENPVHFKVIGEVCAGDDKNFILKNGEAVRIMTGAKMPDGSDCVLRQEDTNGSDSELEIYKSLRHHENYCFCGEDIKKGIAVMKKGEKLSYIHMGVLASLGISDIAVVKKVQVGVLSTGDELLEPGMPLTAGKIYSSNAVMIMQRLADLGMSAIKIPCTGDCAEAIAKTIAGYMSEVDLLITTGGVSVGKKDLLHEVVEILHATQLFWRVKLKPGTPALAAVFENKLLLCLSGNPFAAITTFELLARPILAKLSMDSTVQWSRRQGVLVGSFDKKSMGRRFIRAKLEGESVSVQGEAHSSGVLYSMVGCNALVDISAGSPEKKQGDIVNVVVL